MKTAGGSDTAKRRAGESAAALVTDGMTVGLGTGSTAAHAIRELGRRVEDGLDIRGVPTSFASRELAREVGVPVVDLEDVETIDLAVDGADQLTADGDCIKGGGAAHAREKIVDAAAERFVLVADPSKRATPLSRSVPIEVLPAARSMVARSLRSAGGEPTLRAAERKDGPVITDNGNVVLDCDFGPIETPAALATTLDSVPGVVEHGLFVDLADELHLGTDDGVSVVEF
ncbi:ribose-5-phosphate isomerase RpiA [Haloferacaceae archaeon DSL9]